MPTPRIRRPGKRGLELAERTSSRNIAKYDAFYLRGDNNGELTVDRTTFGARDEYTVSSLTYAFADAHFLRDKFKQIDYLVAPVVGVGHHLIKDATLDGVEGGLGFVVEKDAGLARETSGAVQAKQLLTWKFSPTARLGETAAGLWKTKDFEHPDAAKPVETFDPRRFQDAAAGTPCQEERRQPHCRDRDEVLTGPLIVILSGAKDLKSRRQKLEILRRLRGSG